MARRNPTLEDEMVDDVPAPSVEQLNLLRVKVNEARAKASEIATVESHLSELNKEYQTLTVAAIPALMASAGVDEFKMDDGTKVTIKDFINGSLPKDIDERREALHWLQSVGAGDIIKEQIEMAFGRGSRKVAEQVKKALKKLSIDFNAAEGVHPQTLYAFVRERMRDGEPVPFEKLGLHAGRVAKIETPKDKK